MKYFTPIAALCNVLAAALNVVLYALYNQPLNAVCAGFSIVCAILIMLIGIYFKD